MEKSPFQIIVVGCGQKKFSCSRTSDIYRSIEQCSGNPFPKGCRNGGCGVCKVKVLEGKYTTLPMSREHVTVEEESMGYALCCRIIPESDLVVEILSPKLSLSNQGE